MEKVIVTFQNKKDKDFSTPPMEVSSEFCAEEMEKLLNVLLCQDKTYAFFYEGKQITSIPEVKKEETLTIEFLPVTKIASESGSIEMDDKITSFSIRRHPEARTDSVVICTMNGTTKEYSLAPGLAVLKEFSSFHPIRMVSSTEKGLFVLTTSNKVVDIESAEIVFEAEQPIISISTSQDLLAVGLSTKEVVVLRGKEEVHRVSTEDEVGRVLLRTVDSKVVLIVGIVSGSIEIVDTATWKKTVIPLDRPITAMGCEDGQIYVGGMGGVLMVCSLEKVEKEHQSDVKFISRIECGTVFFGYTDKNRVHLRDKETWVGTHLIELSNQVTDIKISGKRLFVAEDCSLKLFNIFEDE
ncbi:hypothetical protein NECID01_1049 [Nematocida sp. AWRm77]|nr:hypothetical protein NECID01_1049 [Nematocida sp. AWRm77]